MNMKKEISAAADFLTRLVGQNKDFPCEQIEIFQRNLGTLMTEKFKDHWFPEKPFKGQAYRCIRVNERERKDPLLERAAEMCGLKYENLKLPVELTVWVDPEEVCCRFGEEDGSYCTVASFKDNKENVPNIEIVLKSTNQNSQESKKQKKSKKPLEKQKKATIPPKNYIIPPGPNSYHHKGNSSYLDFNSAVFSSRFARANGFLPHEIPYMYPRRPKKAVVRSICPNDRYHWARK